MTQLKNDRFLKALFRQPVDKTPVWMMRQAGRYLPEYRQVRSKAGDFMSLCKNTELACEVTLQPLERFELDAAILFSDILTIPDAMGLGLYFEEGEGPKFRKPVRTEADIDQLQVVNTAKDLSYVTDAVTMIRRELNGRVPLIGFSGSPWTLATYMIEGQSSRDFARAKTMLYTQPELMHQLLEKLTLSVIDYLNAQIRAGAQVVQIFDTWGAHWNIKPIRYFHWPTCRKIINGLITHADGRDVPVILFTKGGGHWLEAMAATGCHCLGLDWTVDIGSAKKRVGSQVSLQGNMDPAVLRADKQTIESKVQEILQSFGSGNGHIFNLGHGITPDIDPANAKIFIDAVHRFSEGR